MGNCQLPIDNNWIANQIRPITNGTNYGLFAGSLRASQRAVALVGLIRIAKLSGHDSCAYPEHVSHSGPTVKVCSTCTYRALRYVA